VTKVGLLYCCLQVNHVPLNLGARQNIFFVPQTVDQVYATARMQLALAQQIEPMEFEPFISRACCVFATIWCNSKDITIRDSQTLTAFKRHLKTHRFLAALNTLANFPNAPRFSFDFVFI